MFLYQHGFLHKFKPHYVYVLVLFGCLYILQPQKYFAMINNNNSRQLSSTNTSNFSRWSESAVFDERCRVMTTRCEQSHTRSAEVKSDAHSSWLQVYPWLNSALFPVASKSLLYCAVPKIASKSLISLIIYVYVRDTIDHLKTNRTENRVAAERLIDIPKLTDQLLQNGVLISETNAGRSVLTVLEAYLHLLRFESVSDTSPSLYFNPWRLNLKEVFPSMHFTSVANFSQLLSPSFTRVLFVRHPFERLASAYKERIATLAKDRIQPESHYDQVRKIICYRYGRLTADQRPLPDHRACEKVIPAFEHFVEFILEDTHTPIRVARMDGHWKPFTVVCQTCQLQYNFIGKYETFDQDFTRLLQRLNVSEWNIQKRRGASGYRKGDYQRLYSSLPDGLICRLKNLYREDLHLFNYRIEDYVNRPSLICPS